MPSIRPAGPSIRPAGPSIRPAGPSIRPATPAAPRRLPLGLARPVVTASMVLLALAPTTVITGCTSSWRGPGSGPAGSAAAPGQADPLAASAAAVRARADLEALPAATQRSIRKYRRERFPHWSRRDDGCDTRDLVLRRDGKAVTTAEDCRITGGTWYSPYDGKTATDPRQVDIDHLVPLANAWRSGADRWTDEQRERFANDLERPQLLAVSSATNREKRDQDPSQWRPPNQRYWCPYALQWITVKRHWALTVTSEERSALLELLDTC